MCGRNKRRKRMADRLHVGTRKGLFELVRSNGGWEIVNVRFLGDPVSAVLAEPDGSLYAALDLGHFGAKLWRRDPAGEWSERAVPGRLWAGTMPGGLFHSDEGGMSWSLNEALWRMPERRQWLGVAGGEQPGINSVLIDPRNPADIRVGVSTAGMWASTDGGKSWRIINQGMYAEYMPPEQRG